MSTRTVVIRLSARVHGDPSIARWAAESHRRRRAADRVTARTALHLLRADPETEIEFVDPATGTTPAGSPDPTGMSSKRCLFSTAAKT
uniref:hypothetical protein n=1 Tax=Herbidospora sakaeratensis TaxID=564415 RepID=UPI0012FCA4F1|nr:hypothetical protein [Herbidospora sakaeratensis]